MYKIVLDIVVNILLLGFVLGAVFTEARENSRMKKKNYLDYISLPIYSIAPIATWIANTIILTAIACGIKFSVAATVLTCIASVITIIAMAIVRYSHTYRGSHEEPHSALPMTSTVINCIVIFASAIIAAC